MRLLLDEQNSGRVAERLVKAGHDTVAVTTDPERRGLSDEDVFESAQRERRIVVTYDLDFLLIANRYAQDGREHHGLVMIHPVRLPNHETARTGGALTRFANEFVAQPSFVAWLSG